MAVLQYESDINVKGKISVTGGLPSEFLKADGTKDASVYLTANQTISLSGDLNGSGATTIFATIGANKVTNAMLVQVNTGIIKGRVTAASGNVEDLTAAQVRVLLNVADGANNYVHPVKTWADKTDLAGAVVISNLAIDASGHPTNWTTRTLTLANLGYTGAADANNYVHPTGDGNLHVPATGTTNNGKVLMAGATAGSLSWGTISGGTQATSTVLGTVKLFSDAAQSVAANAVSATASRTYGVQLNASGQAVVNVPWVDTDTNTWVQLTGTVSGFVPTQGSSSTNHFLNGNAGWTTFGATAGTIAQGNDSRFTDARTPLAHTHSWGDITSGKPTTVSGYGITDAFKFLGGLHTGGNANTFSKVNGAFGTNWGDDNSQLNTPPGMSYGPVLVFGDPVNQTSQIAIGSFFGNENKMFFRGRSIPDGDNLNGWGAWRTVLTDNNYNLYSPSLTGVGASGTWSIQLRGTDNTYEKSLLVSGSGRPDNASGDTWIFADSAVGAANAWGIKHNQLNNNIEFFAGGSRTSYIDLQNGIFSGVATRATRSNGNFYIDDNHGLSVVGVYASDKYQGVFSMGDAYKPSADGTSLSNHYGIAWTHTNVGGQSKAGLGHQMLITSAGTTRTAIGDGIWTIGGITAASFTGNGSGLTGTASGLSIGGNARGINIGAAQSISDLNILVSDAAAVRFDTFNSTAINKPVSVNNSNGVISFFINHGPEYGKQIAFADNDELYIRKLTANTYGDWKTMIHSGNIGSQSVDNSTKWNGQTYNGTLLSSTPTYVMSYDGSVWRPSNAGSIQSFLGLGSNAYTSTAYLPTAGGFMTGKIYTQSTGADTYGGAFEIRERDLVLATQSDWSYAPAITFHWGNRYSKRLGIGADGQLALDNVSFINSINIASQSVNYANSAGSANFLPTSYNGAIQTNPQSYFNNGIGLKVAMTGAWSVWSDTLWINGYNAGDVPNMCALHFLRNGQPRMAISTQAHSAASYGTMHEVVTSYNIGSQSVATANSLTNNQTNWASVGGIGNVVGMLAWKAYGNNHVIFDASASTSPSGSAVNNTNPQYGWTAAYPTLMGWNGSGTYGVRVDSARVADTASDVPAHVKNISQSTLTGVSNMLGVTSLPYGCDITVNGDANTFYQVQLFGGDQDVWRRIIIKRGYSETAPWDPIGTGVHHGGLLLDWEGNFGGWGGAEYADRIRVFNESYTNVCADMFISSHSMGYTFMLRGGGAVYHIYSDQPINGFHQSGSPDILYSTSQLSYDDTWSGSNTYDVPAATPLSLSQVNSSRIDGLRTKKQSLLDSRYLLNTPSQRVDGANKLWSTSHPNDFYISNAWTGTHWQLTSNHGSGVRVAYADNAAEVTRNGVTFSEANAWGRIKTASGYIDFGPANSSYAHIYTDRPNFYFNKDLQINGQPVIHSGNYSSYALPLSGGNISGSVRINSDNVTFTVGNNGDVGIVKTSGFAGRFAVGAGTQFTIVRSNSGPAISHTDSFNNVFNIDTSNNATFYGSATAYAFYQTSDMRLKNILSRDGDVIKFKWADGRDNKIHTGYGAQEMQLYYPEQVSQDEKGEYSVNYVEILVDKVNRLERKLKELGHGLE